MELNQDDTIERPRLHGYIFAAVSVAIACLAIELYPPFKSRGAFLLMLTAVTTTSWYGGARAAILAMVLSAVAATLFILPPTGSFMIRSAEDVVRLCLFLFSACAVSSLYEARVRAERALQTSRNRLLYILEQSGMGVWEIDLLTGDVWWSANLMALFGQPTGNFARTYESFIGYIHPDDQNFVRGTITRTAVGGTDFEIDHRIICKDRGVRWIKTRGRVIRDVLGGATKVVASTIEIPDAPRDYRDRHLDETLDASETKAQTIA